MDALEQPPGRRAGAAEQHSPASADLGDEPGEAPRARAEWNHFDGFAIRPSAVDLSPRRLIAIAVLATTFAGLAAGLLVMFLR